MSEQPAKITLKSALGIVARLRKLLSPKESGDEEAISPAPSGAPPSIVQQHFKHFAFTTYILRSMAAMMVALLIANVAVWFAAHQLSSKPALLYRALPSLKAQADAHFKMDDVSFDSVAFFVTSTLPLLHGVNDGDYGPLELARGMVAPSIITEARQSFERDMGVIRKNMIHQNLYITEVTHVVSDPKTRRVGAYAKGWLVVAVRKGATPAILIPYRADVVLEANPPSKLNPSPYYLLRREERINDAAIAWDREMAERTANRLRQ